ncbi:tRNA pseudouridine(13) synthase TruD [soil metagenome]
MISDPAKPDDRTDSATATGFAPSAPAAPAVAAAPAPSPPHAYFLTAAIPGIGGILRARPEDFIVEEIPLYDPVGAGEHIYLFVQKVNLATSQLVAILARHFRVRPQAVGYAGLKDKRAVTRQVVSIHVPGKTLADFPALEHERVQVLWADMHANKLRRGHLRANRFAIKVRGIELGAVVRAQQILSTLEMKGVPNRYGPQRFGFFANNHLVGRAMLLNQPAVVLDELLGPKPAARYPGAAPDPREVEARDYFARGDYFKALNTMPLGATAECEALRALWKGATPEYAVQAINPTQRSFFLSAFQSAVFNTVLDARMQARSFDTLLAGDLAFKHEGGSVFAVDDAVLADPTTAERLAALTISPSGPNWGASMLKASGVPLQIELDALHAQGVTEEHLRAYSQLADDDFKGERRALRVPLMYADVEAGGDEHGLFIRCSFELPPGSFATTVMAEVMKVAVEEE